MKKPYEKEALFDSSPISSHTVGMHKLEGSPVLREGQGRMLKPFPHFVRTTFMRKKVEAQKAVTLLNKRLWRFYEEP